MRRSLSPRQRRAWEEALRDKGSIASRTRPRLLLDGKDYTRSVKEWSSSGKNEPALVLEATVADELSPDLEGKEAALDLVLNGVPFAVFRGEVLVVDPDDAGYSGVSCATSGFHLPGTEIPPAIRQFNQSYPSTALYEILSLLSGPGGYAGIDIPLLTEPRFTRLGNDGYAFTHRASDAAGDIRKDTGLTFFDDGDNVARGFVEESLEKPGEPVAEFTVGVDCVGYKHPSRFEERYSEVRVYLENRDADEALLATARIEGKARRNKPLDISTSDPSRVNAQLQANREALKRSTDLEDAEFTVLYPVPFLSRADTVAVTETKKGERKGKRGKWKRRYLVRVSELSHSEDKRMPLKGVQKLDKEEFIADPILVPDFRSPQPLAALWGSNYREKPYFDASLPWARDAGDYVALDVEVAAAHGIAISEVRPNVVRVGEGS